MEQVRQSGWIALGAGIGANARYWLGVFIAAQGGGTWPWATLLINVSGALFLGLFTGCADRFVWGHDTRLLWGVGLAGGYTTFSTFSKESIELIQAGRWSGAVLYISASVLFSILAFGGGLWAASRG